MRNVERMARDIADYLIDDRELNDFIENTDLTSEEESLLRSSHGYRRVTVEVGEILDKNKAHVYSKARFVLDHFSE